MVCDISSDYASWMPVMATVILASFFLLSVVYMLAQIMRKQEWELWVKQELYQTIIATVLVFGIAFIATFACTLSENIAGGDPFEIADQYLYQVIYLKFVPSVLTLYDI
ncbi:MAG: hypothetical protein ABIH99_03545, partial [Candidatus Micrarchaeota archaeon]